MGQSGSLGILFCMPKIEKPIVERSTFLFFHWNRESKIDDEFLGGMASTPETKSLSDSLYPTILILPHPTLIKGIFF